MIKILFINNDNIHVIKGINYDVINIPSRRCVRRGCPGARRTAEDRFGTSGLRQPHPGKKGKRLTLRVNPECIADETACLDCLILFLRSICHIKK